jgi:hypothetical protein
MSDEATTPLLASDNDSESVDEFGPIVIEAFYSTFEEEEILPPKKRRWK